MNGKKTAVVLATALFVTMVLQGRATAGLVNVALGKDTNTSGNPFQACCGLDQSDPVDGDIYTRNHTGNAASEFWQVDLGGTFDLSLVELFNSWQGNPERLDGAILKVLDSSETAIYTSPAITGASTTQLYSYNNGGAGFEDARYIRVEHSNQYLHFTEVMAWADVPFAYGNLATLATVVASQSSNIGPTDIFRARAGHDGMATTRTHTDYNDLTPWYEVDLGSTYLIDALNYISETYGPYDPERRYNLQYQILDSLDQVVYESEIFNEWNGTGPGAPSFGAAGADLPIDLSGESGGGVYGRTVRIRKTEAFSGSEWHAVGELQVFGFVPEPASGLLLGISLLGWIGSRRGCRRWAARPPT